MYGHFATFASHHVVVNLFSVEIMDLLAVFFASFGRLAESLAFRAIAEALDSG